MSIKDLLAELKLCDFIKHMVYYKMSTGSDTVNLIQLSKKKKREEMGRPYKQYSQLVDCVKGIYLEAKRQYFKSYEKIKRGGARKG